MNVAIVAEYNPFHKGHLYQVEKIREEFGSDTGIIAVMSGNYTQRGELAMADKYLRAEWAVRAGVNLVLELPFPYSMSSAETFASAAVKIIDSIGIADAISFGSEAGDALLLLRIAENMLTDRFDEAFRSVFSEEKTIGYPAALELAYRNAFPNELPEDTFSPNNTLAIEYIKAILKCGSSLAIHTVKREGARYSEEGIVSHEFQSAMALRELANRSSEEAASHLPENIQDSFLNAINEGELPTDAERLSSAILTKFMLNSDGVENEIFDVGGGLYFRLKNASFEAKSLAELIGMTETKKFTNARIKRSIWYSYFGVTSSIVKELPKFTAALAFDLKGRALLKSIKERTGFPIITKPSAKDMLPKEAEAQKQLLDSADFVFQLAKPKPRPAADALRKTPFVKK